MLILEIKDMHLLLTKAKKYILRSTKNMVTI